MTGGKRGAVIGIDNPTYETAEREAHLKSFKASEIQILVAPQVLDEGIDVPDADVGIIFAAFQTKRQMIQRMGRILRKKADARRAHFLLLYAVGTSEDPEGGANEEFLDEVTAVADEIKDIRL